MTTHAGSSYVPSAVPSMPAGIYDDAQPADSVPAPSDAGSTSTIIYQPHRMGAPGRRVPTQDARNQTWIPARF